MLEATIGSRIREFILIYLAGRKQGQGREIASFCDKYKPCTESAG